MRQEEAGSHSHSHLVYFQRSTFPSSFPCLDLAVRGSERGQAALRALLLIAGICFIFRPLYLFLHPDATAALSCILHPGLSLLRGEATVTLEGAIHPRASRSLTSSLHPWAGCVKASHGAWFCLAMAVAAKSLQSSISARASTATACCGFGNRAKAVCGMRCRYSMVWQSTAPALRLLPLTGSPAPDPPPSPHTPTQPLSASPSLLLC